MLKRSDQSLAILFVCLGNICRSPMAEGAFREACQKAGLDCLIDSAGTAAFHIGNPPDPRAVMVAGENGVDIGGAKARQLHRDDFYRFTHVFALDRANLEGIKAIAPRDHDAKIGLLLDAVEGREGEPVKDPYYGDEEDFREVWDEASQAVTAIAAKLRERGLNAQF